MHNLVQKYFFPSSDISLTTGTIGLGNKQRNLKEILVEHQLGVDVPTVGGKLCQPVTMTGLCSAPR